MEQVKKIIFDNGVSCALGLFNSASRQTITAKIAVITVLKLCGHIIQTYHVIT